MFFPRARQCSGVDVVDLPHSDKGPRTGAPIVVLLHGFPLDHAMWAPQARALEAAGVRVVVPDLRGFGKAPSTQGPGSMAAYAEDVLRLADRAGLRNFALAGFSMGGYVAFEVVRRAPPGRIAALALVDTRAEPDTDDARKGRYATIEKVRLDGVHVVADAMLQELLSSAAPAELREQVRATMMAQRPEGIVFALEAMATRPGSLETLQKFAGPVAIVVGEKDEITPPTAARLMMQSAPAATLTIVPRAAHLTTLEKADEVNEAMVAWARALTSSP